MKQYKQIGLSIIAYTALIIGVAYYAKKNKYIAMVTQKNPESNNNQSETVTYTTVGYRQNNPLNIRVNANNNWKGKITPPSIDSRFEEFTTMAYGYRAAFILMRNHINNGYNTVAELIRKWAPANENHTDEYINFVCKQTGYLPSTTLNPNNSTQLKNIAYAMSIFENGWNPLPNKEQIDKGWDLI